MTTALRTPRDVLWDACRTKSCCHTTKVVLTGYDLARLMAAFELPADAIAVASPVPRGTPGGFRLRAEGPEHELLLRKEGPLGPAGAPCMFLVRTNGGHALCGAGSARPGACRAFPAVVSGGRLRVVIDQCSCHHWSLLDLDRSERAAAGSVLVESAKHEQAVCSWNEQVADDGSARSVADFCTYLVARCGATDG